MSAYALPDLFPPLPVYCTQEEVGSCGGCCAEVQLTVRKAKVDALHLIQTTVAKPTNRRRRSRGRLTQPRPEELAVQLEMDIEFQGKECTVVRSLWRMRQLREELVEEDYQNLPEFPSLPNHSKLNLTMLQVALESYAPDVEDWLRTIFQIVAIGESPTLTHFVLEPLCFLNTVSPEVYLDWNRTRKQILSSLESIAEHADE